LALNLIKKLTDFVYKIVYLYLEIIHSRCVLFNFCIQNTILHNTRAGFSGY